MNWFRLMGLVGQLGAIAGERGRTVPAGDTGLYLLCRVFCERLEERNPGIVGAAGFVHGVSESPSGFSVIPTPPPRFADVDTELLKND
jgi:hypothetical protein